MSPVVGKVEDGDKSDSGASNLVRAMASTFVLTITNPATLIAFASMFAGLPAWSGGANSYGDASFVVAGVVGGSAGWWLCLTTVIGLFHTKIDGRYGADHQRGSGVLVTLFGLAVLIHVGMKSSACRAERQNLPEILRFFHGKTLFGLGALRAKIRARGAEVGDGYESINHNSCACSPVLAGPGFGSAAPQRRLTADPALSAQANAAYLAANAKKTGVIVSPTACRSASSRTASASGPPPPTR